MPEIRYVGLGRRPVNPLMQIAAVIVGAVVLGFAVIVGAFVLAVLIGLALIAWVVFYARAWWLMRRSIGGGRRGSESGQGEGEIVEAEYRVIETTRRDIERD